MDILSFIVWNADPEIVSFTVPVIDRTITLRWYGLLFALGFLLSQQILYYIFKKEGKPEKDVDTLTIYMVIATVLGARLGHVFFYEPEKYLANPIDILKIWEGGLASHGAAVGILLAIWLYVNYFIGFSKPVVDANSESQEVKKKVRYGFFIHKRKLLNQNYLKTLDRIVILVALTGALIRTGNFANSEIIGKPTESGYGVAFVRSITEVLENNDNIEEVSIVKSSASNLSNPVKILITFTPNPSANQTWYERIIAGQVRNSLSLYASEHINLEKATYEVTADETGQYFGIVEAEAVPRYPAQLYEAFSCILLFAFLFWVWSKHKENLPEGRLFGIFLIVCFGLRFVYEFFKENQVDFESTLPLNMGQFLSIPLVLIGIFVLVRSYRKKETQ